MQPLIHIIRCSPGLVPTPQRVSAVGELPEDILTPEAEPIEKIPTPQLVSPPQREGVKVDTSLIIPSK
jgi:hypothetical protein